MNSPLAYGMRSTSALQTSLFKIHYFRGSSLSMRHYLLIILLFTVNLIFAQNEISGRWSFYQIADTAGSDLLPIDSADYFYLKEDGSFIYELAAKNNLLARGNWQWRSDTLELTYVLPSDTTRYYLVRTFRQTVS
jgi:hypothetical protein